MLFFVCFRLTSDSENIDINITEEEENILNDLDNNIAIMNIIFSNANESGCLNELEVFTPINRCCKETYETLIESPDILKIALETKTDKKLWHQKRQYRITASRCYSLFTYKKNDWNMKAQKYFWPKGFSNKYVKT